MASPLPTARMPEERVWSTALHQTFRLLPTPSPSLRVFLESDGRTRDEVLQNLPYASSRAGGSTTEPNPRRYRDGRQVYRNAGLLYEDSEQRVHVTPLGKATLWWLDRLTESNVPVLGRYASYALSAWQLRNPTPDGKRYAPDVLVFPYSYIWRVMLLTDHQINSEELSRVVLRMTNESQIEAAADRIIRARSDGDVAMLGERVNEDNDRIIPWMSLASFGWTLIQDKREGDEAGYYQIAESTVSSIERASEIRRPHLEFKTELSYFRHIERAAAVPNDLR